MHFQRLEMKHASLMWYVIYTFHDVIGLLPNHRKVFS